MIKFWEKYGKKWTDDHSKGINANRIHAFYQLQAILHSALKPDVSDMCIYSDDGCYIYAPSYRTVDVDLTLNKFCNFLSDTFAMKFIWGRDVLADKGSEVEFFIRCKDDSKISFIVFGEEFAPLYDNWCNLLNWFIPTYFLNTDFIKLYKNHEVYVKQQNHLKGVKNAKKLFEKLVELGY